MTAGGFSGQTTSLLRAGLGLFVVLGKLALQRGPETPRGSFKRHLNSAFAHGKERGLRLFDVNLFELPPALEAQPVVVRGAHVKQKAFWRDLCEDNFKLHG
jgi:hypothetical protein